MKATSRNPTDMKKQNTVSARLPKPGASVLALLLAACATPPGSVPIIPGTLDTGRRTAAPQEAPPVRETSGLKIQELPVPPKQTSGASPTQTASTPGLPRGSVSAVNLEQIALGNFAQVVYAEVLKKNVSVDARVLSRRDLVTFRTGADQTVEQLEQAVKLLLRSYGVAVVDSGGLVRIVPDDASTGTLPEIRRGAANPETPVSLRPIFHLVELESVRPGDIAGMLRTLFGDRVRANEDPVRNALLVSGNPDNLAAALEAIRVLDQPVMAGRSSLALTPSYWSADELARRLFDVLGAEGYVVQPLNTAAAGGVRAPIILLPVTALNSVFVFANSDALRRHVADWAARLDKPNERGIGRNYFTYAVKHKDAAQLAVTLDQLISGSKPVSSGTGAAQTPATASSGSRSTNVVVDNASNTLIFQANPEEYTQILTLLQNLDKPAKSALIEVTVAELTVDKNSQLGVEWFFSEVLSGGRVGQGGTLGGLAIGNSGFSYRILTAAAGSPRLLLNALATDNKATILSSPRVSARNGETATIQVGQEVPIITSQQSTNTTSNNGSLGTLQTIQYRSTGVILKVKPVIHAGDQIDLDVAQEVSAAVSTNTGVNNSPTISTRKLDTKLTLRHGATVMLGGLISDETGGGSAGIPLLKDIPLIGNLFSNQTTSGRRRELIVLITPYIINNTQDAEALTDAFRGSLGTWAKPPSPQSIPDLVQNAPRMP